MGAEDFGDRLFMSDRIRNTKSNYLEKEWLELEFSRK